jgi:hypothetical protein
MMNAGTILLIAIIVLVSLWAFRKVGKSISFLARFCVYLVAIFVCSVTAQNDSLIITDVLSDDHPIILDQPVMVQASNTLLGWLEQDFWNNNTASGPGWLNATVNLTANVTA